MTLSAISHAARRIGQGLLFGILVSGVCVTPAAAQSGLVLPDLLGSGPGLETDLTDGATVTETSGDSPAAEGVDNLADNDTGSKYLVFQNGAPGPVVTDPIPVMVDFAGGASNAVTAYTLTSANDAPERDPYEWTVFGSNNGVDFTQVDFRTGVEYSDRFETQAFFFDNPTAYSSYKIEFKTEAGAGGPNGSGDIFQVAELELFSGLTEADVDVNSFQFGGMATRVNRETGEILLRNDSPDPITIVGYSVTSAAGALNSDVWTPIAGNTDGSPGGDGSVDDDPWVLLTADGARGDISEVEDPGGDGAVVGAFQSISLGNAWLRSPTEDLVVDVQLADLSVVTTSVFYTQGDGVSFGPSLEFGDLNANGSIDGSDWTQFKNGQGTDFSSITSQVESYGFGDMDGDFDHDLYDFNLFRTAFDGANGPGAFAALISGQPVPEPAALLLVAIALGAAFSLRRFGYASTVLGVAVFGLLVLTTQQSARAGIEIPGLIGSDLTDPGDTGSLDVTVAVGATSPGAELPEFALDNTLTSKWLSFDPNGTFYEVTFNDSAVHAVNSYTITSGNDAPERDPYTWTLSGSNDGTNFTIIDTQEANVWSGREVTQQFFAPNMDDYNIYRFDFLTQQGAGAPNAPGTNSIQIQEIELFELADPTLLTLQVNTDSGVGTIVNGSDSPIDIISYRITSESGSLDSSWDGLQAQDSVEFPSGDGSGNGWERGPNASTTELVEWYLTGDSTFSSSDSVGIGSVFASPVAGDYNLDGSVNLADYTIWRDTLGASVANGTGADGDSDGVIGQGDYTVWKGAFGQSSGAGQQDLVFQYQEANGNFAFGFVEYVSSSSIQTAAVPEPSSWVLSTLALAAVMVVGARRYKLKGVNDTMDHSTPKFTVVANVLLLAIVACAGARASTPDRDYRFGDDPAENPNPAAAVGDIVGANNTIAIDTTLDSMGPDGAFLDLSQNNDPIYVDTSATGRPFATANELGIRFDGVDQYLQGEGLGNPGQGDVPPNAPGSNLNYDGLFARTMQAYVRPTNAGSGVRQDVFFDTSQFGLFIDESDNWGVEYGAPGTISTTIPVEFNEWTHVMHRVTGGAVILYVDGVVSRIALGFFNPNPGGADENDMWFGSGIGGTSNFFQGDLDDFQLLISGDNSDQENGQDFGAFDLGTDNDFVRETLAAQGFVEGDVNGDGVVNGDGFGDPASDDVAFFVDNWLAEYVADGFIIGDLNSRTQMADLNFSGTTNLFDWAILRENHVDAQSLNLGAILAARRAQVPEPTSAALLGLAIVLLAVKRVSKDRP